MSGMGENNGYVGGTAIDNMIARKFMERMKDAGVFPPPTTGPVDRPPQPYPNQPPTTPQMPDMTGLLAQTADPWSVYGQIGVNEPYMSNINNRFGWSPQGLAYPTQLQQSPSWYNPKTVYPAVVQPPINPRVTK